MFTYCFIEQKVARGFWNALYFLVYVLTEQHLDFWLNCPAEKSLGESVPPLADTPTKAIYRNNVTALIIIYCFIKEKTRIPAFSMITSVFNIRVFYTRYPVSVTRVF